MSQYRFNNLTGKIISGTQRLGQGIKAGAPAEAPQIIFETQKVKFPTATVQSVKARKAGYGEVPTVLLKKYQHFQVDNGVPIHLKGGQTDVILYYTTLVGCAVGLFECFRYYYEASFPKKV